MNALEVQLISLKARHYAFHELKDLAPHDNNRRACECAALSAQIDALEKAKREDWEIIDCRSLKDGRKQHFVNGRWIDLQERSDKPEKSLDNPTPQP